MVTPGLAKKKGARKPPLNVFKPGHPKKGGRQKGTPNKITVTMKQAIINAFNRVGGEDYLVKAAKGPLDMRKAFLAMCSKTMPLEVQGGDKPLTFVDATKLADMKPKELKQILDAVEQFVAVGQP